MKRIANVIFVLVILGLIGPMGVSALPLDQGTSGTITSPVEGQILRGVVTITGSATGDQFEYYKVEYRPEGAADDVPWVLVGDDVRHSPVADGALDTWDTTQVPDGAYALRLSVVDVTGNYQEITVHRLLVQNTVTPTPIPMPTPVATPTPSVTTGQEMLTPEGLMTQLAEINEIIGAVYDPGSGIAFLVGRVDPNLPPLNLDDWVMAIRIIYGGDFPAVSIDPGPDNSVMNVRYFGNVENTHFGWVMFEADRMLKIYSMGVDNLNGQPVTSAVAGYKNELELSDSQQGWSIMPVWHRMWFEPAAGNGPVVTTSGDQRVILFDTANMVVKTEYVSIAGSPKPEGSDPAAEKFVEHFNQHFVEFAAERSVLHNLTQLHRYVIIARWLKDQGVPVDMLWVKDWPVVETETPATTPRVSASRNFGSFILMLGGGVDLSLENQYQQDDTRIERLLKAIRNVPTIRGVRSGQFEFEGSDYQVISFPVRRTSYFQEVDAQGRTWVIDRATGQLLCLIDETGNITNFDDYDDNYLRQKTMGLTENTVKFDLTDGSLSSVDYALQETMKTDLPLLLAALQRAPLEAPLSQQSNYDYLAQNNMLTLPAWVSLQTANGEEMSVWPVEARGEQFIVMLADEATLAVPADEVVTNFQLGEQRARLITGESAFHLHNRMRTAAMSMGDRIFSYLCEENGVAILQLGQQTLPLDLPWDEWKELLLYSEPGDPEWEELTHILDQIVAITGLDAELTIFSGQGFPDTPEGEDMKKIHQAMTEKLALALRRHGIQRVSTDDDIERAKANLDNQQPIMVQGKWNTEMIIDDNSLANLSDTGREYTEQTGVLAETAGILVHANWESLTEAGNVVFVTAHNSEELRRTLSELSKDTLQSKYLVLAVCGEKDTEVVDHEFIRNVLIHEYRATGVFAFQYRISPKAVQILFEEFVKLGQVSPNLKANLAMQQAVENALRRDDLSDEDKVDLNRLRANQSFISMLNSDLQALFGLG